MTSDDLVPRILAAIEATEQDARADIDHFDDVPQPEDPRDRYIVNLAKDTLRRCLADRRRLERHWVTPDTWGNPTCGYDRDGDETTPFPCPDVLDVADSYGVAPATEPADRLEAP